MESDAKLGLLAGVAGVVAVAVVYFQKPADEGVAASQPDATAVVGSSLPTPVGVTSEKAGKILPVARPTSYVKPAQELRE